MRVEIDEKSPGLMQYLDENLLSQEDAQKVARFWPHKQKTGGFFIAKLKKLSSLPYTPQYDKRKKEKI